MEILLVDGWLSSAWDEVGGFRDDILIGMGEGEEGVPKSERRLSSNELAQLGDALEPVWNELFLAMQQSLLGKVEEMRKLGSGQGLDDMSDRQVLALAPLALSAKMNALTHPKVREGFVKMLEAKGMATADAEKSIESISNIVSAGITSNFDALGKALHGEHDLEDKS